LGRPGADGLRFVLGQLPRLVRIDALVHAVGQQHDLAHRLAVLALDCLA